MLNHCLGRGLLGVSILGLSYCIRLLQREGECVVDANELCLGSTQAFKADDDAKAPLRTQVLLELDNGYLRRMLGVFANTN